MTQTDSDERERTRKNRIAGGIVLAIAGVTLFVLLFTGLADQLKDRGGASLVLLFGLRALACWAVAGGGWVAYKAWNRLDRTS